MRYRMANFVPNHGGQTCIVAGEGQDSGVHTDFAARQTKGIGLFAFENHKFPLGVGQVLAGDCGDAFADSLDHSI